MDSGIYLPVLWVGSGSWQEGRVRRLLASDPIVYLVCDEGTGVVGSRRWQRLVVRDLLVQGAQDCRRGVVVLVFA